MTKKSRCGLHHTCQQRKETHISFYACVTYIIATNKKKSSEKEKVAPERTTFPKGGYNMNSHFNKPYTPFVYLLMFASMELLR